jgi:hypothetical protein
VTTSELTIDARAPQRLVLARLLVPTKDQLSREEVITAVARAMMPPLGLDLAKREAQRALEAAERNGYVANQEYRAPRSRSRVKPRKRAPVPAPTAKGQLVARDIFGGLAMPVIQTWEHAQQLVGLSLLGRPEAAAKPLRSEPLAALVLSLEFGVPASIGKLPAVVDYLSWRAIGAETNEEFTVEAVQRYLLRSLVPGHGHNREIRDPEAWRRALAMHAIGAHDSDAEALTHALMCVRSKSKRRARTRPANDNAQVVAPPRAARSRER